jgi:hypothetical protein
MDVSATTQPLLTRFAIGPAPAAPVEQRVGELVETKSIRVGQLVAVGDWIAGWRVYWIGGWDKGRVYFVAMIRRSRQMI